MIYRRVAKRDDRRIFTLIQQELMPFTHQSFPDLKLNLKDLRSRLSKVHTLVVKQSRSKPCKGFMTYLIHDHELWVDMLAVDQQQAGKGFGSQLMSKVERIARQKGCTMIKLHVDEVNPKAQLFYAKKGFRPVNYEPKLKCFVYQKDLI